MPSLTLLSSNSHPENTKQQKVSPDHKDEVVFDEGIAVVAGDVPAAVINELDHQDDGEHGDDDDTEECQVTPFLLLYPCRLDQNRSEEKGNPQKGGDSDNRPVNGVLRLSKATEELLIGEGFLEELRKKLRSKTHREEKQQEESHPQHFGQLLTEP